MNHDEIVVPVPQRRGLHPAVSDWLIFKPDFVQHGQLHTMLLPTTRIPEHCPSYMPNSPLDETCNCVHMLAAGLFPTSVPYEFEAQTPLANRSVKY